MKYRIRVETTANGENKYYVEALSHDMDGDPYWKDVGVYFGSEFGARSYINSRLIVRTKYLEVK
jgi:hypothetical protein